MGRRGFYLSVFLLYVFLLSPLLILIATSFNGRELMTFPPANLTWIWFVRALTRREFIEGILNSAALAGLATGGSLLVGLAAAYALCRAEFPGKNLLFALFMSPLIVPGLVVGIALLILFASLDMPYPWIRLGVGHLLFTLPFTIRTVSASLLNFDLAVEESAMTLGASRMRTFRYITLPLIKPGLLAGALFSFIVSFDNVPISLFLVGADTTTLPIAMLSYVEYELDTSVASLSTVLIVVSVVLAVLIERLFGLRRIFGHGSGHGGY